MAFTDTTVEIFVSETSTTQVIPITFPFVDSSHLVVENRNDGTTLVENTDYSVTGGGQLAGSGGYNTGNVTLINSGAHAIDDQLTIRRETPGGQSFDFASHSPLSGPNLESALDRLAMRQEERRTDYVGAYRTLPTITAERMIPQTTSGPELVTTEYGPANQNVMVRGYSFDGASNEHLQFVLSLPEEWNTVLLGARFFWKPASGTSGTVKWAIAARSWANDDSIESYAWLTSGDGYASATDTIIATTDLHIITASPLAPVSPGIGEMLQFRVSREASSDSSTGDAVLIAVQIQYLESTTNPSIWTP